MLFLILNYLVNRNSFIITYFFKNQLTQFKSYLYQMLEHNLYQEQKQMSIYIQHLKVSIIYKDSMLLEIVNQMILFYYYLIKLHYLLVKDLLLQFFHLFLLKFLQNKKHLLKHSLYKKYKRLNFQ